MQYNPSDSELIYRAKAGDHGAVTQIYERYAPAIYRYIYFRVGEVELAEDLQADVFLRMLEGIHRYEDRGWPISAWLYRIAHDRTVDTMRRRRVRQHVPLETWGGACEGPESTVDERLDYEEIGRMMNELTDDQRQVIHMRFMADMSIQEVASRLGRTEGSVKALQHRGLQSLARRLASSAA
ncbi:MAG TPA: sigma-70 family RNA polymerase sigma factor [Roseiflexaceae bacterium]|nr:sigma-70 family RNA polymerase sigma factor [Roseiflexaceae bacterium]